MRCSVDGKSSTWWLTYEPVRTDRLEVPILRLTGDSAGGGGRYPHRREAAIEPVARNLCRVGVASRSAQGSSGPLAFLIYEPGDRVCEPLRFTDREREDDQPEDLDREFTDGDQEQEGVIAHADPILRFRSCSRQTCTPGYTATLRG